MMRYVSDKFFDSPTRPDKKASSGDDQHSIPGDSYRGHDQRNTGPLHAERSGITVDDQPIGTVVVTP